MFSQSTLHVCAGGGIQKLQELKNTTELAVLCGFKDFNVINWLTVEMSRALGYPVDHQEVAWAVGFADAYPEEVGLDESLGFGTQIPPSPIPRRAKVRFEKTDGMLVFEFSGKSIMDTPQDLEKFEVYRMPERGKPILVKTTRSGSVTDLKPGTYFVVVVAQSQRSMPSELVVI